MPEMIFIFLLALILFGPKKLPEIGREIGKFMAEFKRASNDFKYQLQTEIENATAEATPATPSTAAGAQQTSSSSFTQTLISPAVSSVMNEIDNAHDRLMKTARMAFEAQNFTLRPPDSPTVASAYPESLSATTPSEPVETSIPASTVSAESVSHQASPVEAANDQPSLPLAPARSESASQNS